MITKNTLYKDKDSLIDFINNSFLDKSGSFLVQIFSGIADVQYLTDICKTIRGTLNNCTIVGTSTSGEIMNGKNYDKEVVISISQFVKSKIRGFIINSEGLDEFELGKKVISTCIKDNDKLLILFTDGLNTIGVDLLRYLNEQCPGLYIAGGKAGDNKLFDQTFVFDGNIFLSTGICGALISGESLNINQEYSFGWSRVGKILKVTRSHRNRLYEIDGIPAYDFYKNSLGEEIVNNLPHIGGQFPLIIIRDGIKIAREIIKRHDDGSFSLSGDIKENEAVQIGCGQINNILKMDKKIIAKTLNGKSIESIFVYSCSGRKSFLGKYSDKEIGIFNCFGDCSGFYGYGVFYHSQNGNYVLNETMVILTISESDTSIIQIKDPHCKCLDISSKYLDQKDIGFYGTANLLKNISDELNKINLDLVNTLQAKQIQITNAQNEFHKSYKVLIDNMNLPICMLDEKRKFIYINSEFSNFLGYCIEDIRGVYILDLFDEEGRKLSMKHIKNYREKGLTSTYQVKILNKVGEHIPIRVTGMQFHGTLSVVLIYDLREIQHLKEKADNLEKLNKVKSEFVSIASHELRTPMTSIKGYLSMIKDGDYGPISQELESIIDIMMGSTQRQINLINDMLDLNKLESRKMEFNNSIFILYDLLVELKNDFVSLTKDKNIQLTIEIQDEKVKLNTDRDKLKQVFINLIGNSIKFTPSGGKIVLLATNYNEKKLTIHIVDNGIGIAPSNHHKISQKFTQVDSPLNRQSSGTGLGIPISTMLIEKMGGKLNLKSDVGKGSDFYFTLPIHLND